MIELDTGNLSFPELNLTLHPLISREVVTQQLPKGRFHQIQDSRTGYCWYGMREKIYKEDTEIPIWLCFDQDKRLESVELYPQFSSDESMEGWPQDAMDSEQKYCAAWLQRFCGLTWSDNGFPWGTIISDYDPRSDSCGIVIRYTKESTDRREEM